jgi:uncharacterized protein YhaN
MHIKAVSLKGFGILSHHTLEFSEDKINIIVGNNETGKSTLCSAIVAIIYGLPSKSESENRRSWDYSGDFRGTIELDYGDAAYRIERDFETNDLRMLRLLAAGEEVLFEGDANPKGRTEQPRAYRKLLDDLGFPPETIFRSAIYIAQQDLEMEIDDELRQHLSGAGQADYLKALSDLEKQHYSLTRQNLPGDSPKRTDKLLEEKIAHMQKLEARLEESKIITVELADSQNKSVVAKERYQQLAIRKTEIESEKKALGEYLQYIEVRSSLDQRIKLVVEKNGQGEFLENSIDDLNSQLTGKFAVYHRLSAESLRELESYVQSDAEGTFREIQDLERQEQQLSSELDDPQFIGFSILPDDATSILERLAEERRYITELTKQLIDNVDHLKGKRPRWAVIILLVFMSIVGVILGVTAIFLLKNNFGTGIAVALIIFGVLSGFSAAVLSITRNSRIQRVKEREAEVRTQIEEKERHITELGTRISPLMRNFDEKTLGFAAIQNKWEQYQQKRRILTGLDARRKVLEGREILKSRSNSEIEPVLKLGPAMMIRDQLKEFHTIKSKLEVNKENLQKTVAASEPPSTAGALQSQYRDVIIFMDELEKKNPSFNAYREDRTAGRVQLSKLQAESEKISSEIGQVDQTIRSLEVRLGQFSVSEIIDPQLLEEEISVTQEAIVRIQERISALRIAIEVLMEAIKEYQESHLSRLSQLATSSFSDFTRGSYKSLEIVPGKDPQITTNKNRTIQLTQLSVGANDQLFFALRLAISEILSNEISLPLILDDTFVNFDKMRLEAVHKTLININVSRQIILLSHDSNYITWGSPPKVHSDN